MEEDAITKIIIGSAIKVHRALGPGLLESGYRAGLAHDLRLQRLHVEIEKTLPLVYAGIRTKKERLIINFNVRWLKEGLKRVINPRL